MKNLLHGILADMAMTAADRQREKTQVAKWTRHNATVQRNLPTIPDDGNTPWGILYALAADEGEQTSEDTEEAPKDAPSHLTPADTALTPPVVPQDGRRGPPGDNPANVSTPPPRGPQNGSTASWLPAALAVGIAVGGLGIGYGIGNRKDAPPAPKPDPQPQTTVIERRADSSLLQWLEDNGHHLPPNNQLGSEP
jgi:hypothetical protein